MNFFHVKMDEATEDDMSKDCIIHHPSVQPTDNPLVTPANHQSWLTLLEAARIRNHTGLLNKAKTLVEGETPSIFYHRKCRSLFTIKQDLQALKRKADESYESNVKRSSLRVSSSIKSRVYLPECIFCCKVKYAKRSNSREKLIQAT